MNIGIFTDTYYPQINGVVTSIRMLEKELNHLGHKVYIFTVKTPESTDIHPRVFRLPSFPFVFLTSHRVAFFYSPKLLLKIKELELDIIHTHTEFPLGIFGKVVSEFYRIPNVHTYHTMYEDYVHYIANGHLINRKMAQQYSRIFCNRAKVVVAPARKTLDSLLEYGVKRPIEFIPTGLDFSYFAPDKYSREEIDEAKNEVGLSCTDKIIVTVCRVAKEKSIDVIIKAMPELLLKLPNVKFVIFGEGPAKNDLINLAKNLGVENAVIFAGSRPWHDIGKYYQVGDCFVSASTSETQGLTYIEAMSGKIPVVAKKDRSVEDIITHNDTGFYFEEDSEAANVLYEVLTNVENTKKVAENGYHKVQELSSINFAKKIEEVYKKVITMTPKKTSAIKIPEVLKKAASYVIDLRPDAKTKKKDMQ